MQSRNDNLSEPMDPSSDAPAAPTGSRWSTRSALGMLFWLALMPVTAAACLFTQMMVHPRSADSSIFAWMGQRMLAGDLPYRDMWDNKLPPLYWLNELAAMTRQPTLAVWLGVAAAVALGGWFVFAIGRRWFSTATAGLAGMTYVTLASSPLVAETGNLTEVWAAPFAIGSIASFLKFADGARAGAFWALVSGLMLGIAVCFRVPAALVAIAFVPLMASVYRARRLRVRFVLFWLIGAAAMPAAIAAWAFHYGVARQVWTDCVLFNFAYGTAAARPAWATWQRVGQVLTELVFDTWPWHLLALVGLAALLVGAPLEKRVVPDLRATRPSSLQWAVLFWLAAAVGSALPSLRLYPHHYYLTVAPLAVLSLWAWQALLGPASRATVAFVEVEPTRRRPIGIALVLLAAAFFAGRPYVERWAFSHQQRDAHAYIGQTADFLAAQDGPHTVFLFGWGKDSDLYAQLGWRCPTRHPMAMFYPELHTGPAMLNQWQAELQKNPPAWLACSLRHELSPRSLPTSPDDDAFEPMRRFWREHYEFVREFPSDRDPAIGLAVYRLKTPR